MKKTLLSILIVTIVVQIFIPAYMIWGKYGILEIDEEGFATVKKVEKEQPKGELYLTSQNEDYFYIPLDRYYMEETLAPKAEEMISREKEAYVTIRIKGDKSVLSGLYIDGKPVEEILIESDD